MDVRERRTAYIVFLLPQPDGVVVAGAGQHCAGDVPLHLPDLRMGDKRGAYGLIMSLERRLQFRLDEHLVDADLAVLEMGRSWAKYVRTRGEALVGVADVVSPVNAADNVLGVLQSEGELPAVRGGVLRPNLGVSLDGSTYLDVILRAHSKKQAVLLDALVPGDGVDVLLRFDGVLDGPVPQSAIHGSDDHHLAVQGSDGLGGRASRERLYELQAVVVGAKGNVAGRARKGVKIIQCLPIGFSVATDALLEDLDAGVVHAGSDDVAEHGVGPLDLGDQ